jgi:hypothetical protein
VVSPDPVTPVLLKAGAGLAGRPVGLLLGKATVRMRTAWSSSRSAKARGIKVTARSLYLWLGRSDVREQLETGSESSIKSVVTSLAWIIDTTEDERETASNNLLAIVINKLIRASKDSDATAISHAQTQRQISTESRNVRNEVRTVEASITAVLSEPRTFSEDVRKLHPWVREEIESIAAHHPQFRSIIHTIVSTPDRSSVFRQWHADHPANIYGLPVWRAMHARHIGRGLL